MRQAWTWTYTSEALLPSARAELEKLVRVETNAIRDVQAFLARYPTVRAEFEVMRDDTTLRKYSSNEFKTLERLNEQLDDLEELRDAATNNVT